jgi:hypothetical protein
MPRLSHEVVSARLASGAVPKFQKFEKNQNCVRHGACAKQIVLFPAWQQAAKNYNLPKIIIEQSEKQI